jgi:serine/threonine protein kinase
MNWLHKQGILHLDLKPANILVNDNWIAKVADFGLSQFKDKAIALGGTPNYMAPEMLTGGKIDAKADVYAFGMILWELLMEKYPWEDEGYSLEDFVRVVGREGKRPEISRDCPKRLKELIQHCWAQDPTLRPSFEQIAESNVFYHIILEDMISDPDGQRFWEKYFLTEHEVPYFRFLANLCSFLNVRLPRDHSTDEKFICVRLAFANEKGTVTIEQFARALGWYGPLGKDNTIISRIYSIVAENGFFGEMTPEEAEEMLVNQKPGTLLVRLSSRSCDFVVSAKTKSGQYVHWRVPRKGDGFTFENKYFSTLKEVIEFFKSKKMQCKHVATGSKFQKVRQLLDVDESKFQGYNVRLSTK